MIPFEQKTDKTTCPFCGQHPFIGGTTSGGPDVWFFAVCGTCGLHTQKPVPVERDVWNEWDELCRYEREFQAHEIRQFEFAAFIRVDERRQERLFGIRAWIDPIVCRKAAEWRGGVMDWERHNVPTGEKRKKKRKNRMNKKR